MLSKEGRHLATLQKFNELQHYLNARPKVHNHYHREAWVSPNDNSLRLTIDRDIRIEPFFIANAPVHMARPTRIFGDCVILELKFTTRFPGWFRELVQAFHLMQFSASKYAEGVLIMNEGRFHDGDRSFDWEGWNPRETRPAEQTRNPKFQTPKVDREEMK